MYEKNTIKLLFRLSRIPVAVYNQTWDLQESFPAVLEQPESFEQEKFDELKECLHQESVYFCPMIPMSPLPCAAAKERRNILSWGLFPMGRRTTFKAEILSGAAGYGNVLPAS